MLRKFGVRALGKNAVRFSVSRLRPITRLPVFSNSVRHASGDIDIPDDMSDEEFDRVISELKQNAQMDPSVIEERIALRQMNKETEAAQPPSMQLPLLPSSTREAEVCALWTKASRYGEKAVERVEGDMEYFHKLFNYVPSEQDVEKDYHEQFESGGYDDEEMKGFLETSIEPNQLGYEAAQEYKARAEKMFSGDFIAPDEIDAVVENLFGAGSTGQDTKLKWIAARFKPYPIDEEPSSAPSSRSADPYNDEQVECNEAFYDYLINALDQPGGLEKFNEDKEFFDEIMSEYRNETEVEIESAEPLTDNQKQDLLQRAQQLAPGKTLIVAERVDEKLLAGFTLTVGGQQIDMSVARNVGLLEGSLSEWVSHGRWSHERS